MGERKRFFVGVSGGGGECRVHMWLSIGLIKCAAVK